MWHVSQPPRAPPLCGCSASEHPSSACGEPKASLWGGKSSFLDAACRLSWHSGLFMPGHATEMHEERHFCGCSLSVDFKSSFFTRWSLRSLSNLGHYHFFEPSTMIKSAFQKKALLQKKKVCFFYSGFDRYVQIWEFSFLNILPLMVQVSKRNYLNIAISHKCLWAFLWKKIGINHSQTQDPAEKNHCLTQDWSLLHYGSDTSKSASQRSSLQLPYYENSFPWWTTKRWLSLKICTHSQWNLTSIMLFAYFTKYSIIFCCFVLFSCTSSRQHCCWSCKSEP